MVTKLNNIITSIIAIINSPLCKKKKLQSFLTFLYWTIRLRIPVKNKMVHSWIESSSFYFDSKDAGVLGNIYTGLDEFESMSFLLHAMRQHDAFFDIGSNSGIYSILSGKVVKSNTFSYEPNTECFQRLIDNIKLNNLNEKVLPNKTAVGNRQETRKFTNNLNCVGRFVSEQDLNIDYEYVEVTTLDNQIELHSKDTFFIKIDVEGFEREVFDGGKKSFKNKNCMAVIVEMCGNGKDFGYSERTLFNDIKNSGFIPINYDPFKRKISENKTFAYDGNIIFIKNLKTIQDRVQNAKSFHIKGHTL